MKFVAVVVVVVAGCAAPRTPAPVDRAPAPRWVVSPTHGLGLFKDEQQRGAQLVSTWLDARSIPVADRATLDGLALATRGRSPLTGEACGRPLSLHDAVRRWGAALGLAGTVSSSVWCPADRAACELSLSAYPLEETAQRFRFEAPLERQGALLTAFEAAVAKLAPPPPTDGGVGGLGLLGAMGNRDVRRADELEVRVSVADRRAPLDGGVPAGPAVTVEQAVTCLGADDDSAALLIDVDGVGTVSRCEAEYEDRQDEQTACLCGQLTRAGPQPSLAGRRWHVSFFVRRRDHLSRDGRFVVSAYWNTHLVRVKTDHGFPRFEERIEDASLKGWSPAPARLAEGCFGGRTEPGKIASRWAVWFDARGNATKVEQQKGYEPLEAQTTACVARALMTSQAPCPSRGGLWAMADLHVTLRDPNEKPANVFGAGGLGTGLKP